MLSTYYFVINVSSAGCLLLVFKERKAHTLSVTASQVLEERMALTKWSNKGKEWLCYLYSYS
jgi:hypothetical protein